MTDCGIDQPGDLEIHPLTRKRWGDFERLFGARGAWVFPIDPSLRLVVDVIEYCTRALPPSSSRPPTGTRAA